MTIGIIVGVAFAIGLLLGWRTLLPPLASGCMIPIAAAALMMLWLIANRHDRSPGYSTAAMAVPIFAVLAFCGGLPGVLIGCLLRTRHDAED